MDFDGILNTPYSMDVKPADLASYSTADNNNLATNSQHSNTASADILSDFVNTQLKYNDIWGAALGQSGVHAQQAANKVGEFKSGKLLQSHFYIAFIFHNHPFYDKSFLGYL